MIVIKIIKYWKIINHNRVKIRNLKNTYTIAPILNRNFFVPRCACPAREINLLFNWAFSMTYWKAMHVTLNEGSQECVMSIVNIDKTKSKEHKLKLTSIMVSGELAFVESWDNCKVRLPLWLEPCP